MTDSEGKAAFWVKPVCSLTSRKGEMTFINHPRLHYSLKENKISSGNEA